MYGPVAGPVASATLGAVLVAPVPRAAPGVAPVVAAAGARTNNVESNVEFFITLRNRSVRSASICRSIRANAFPALPVSKVDFQSMCLAFHAKG